MQDKKRKSWGRRIREFAFLGLKDEKCWQDGAGKKNGVEKRMPNAIMLPN